MLRYCSGQIVRSLTFTPTRHFSEGTEFLNMVEKYFDNAGKHTDIRPDILNFYKRADNVVKFNLTLTRGNYPLTQMMDPLKLFLLIVVSIRLINYQPKEELDTHKMSI